MEVGVGEGAVVIVVTVEAARARVGMRTGRIVVKCILKGIWMCMNFDGKFQCANANAMLEC